METNSSKGQKFTGLRREMLFPLLFDVAIPLAGYYGLRLLGVQALIALTLGIFPTVVYQVYQILKNQKVDSLALFILGIILISMATSFVTGSPRFMLAKSGWVTGLIGLGFCVSLFFQKPIAFTIAKSLFERSPVPQTDLDTLWEKEPEFQWPWKVVTVIWSVGTLLNAVIIIYFAYALPVDNVPLLVSVLHISTFFVLQLITNTYLNHQGVYQFIFDTKPV